MHDSSSVQPPSPRPQGNSVEQQLGLNVGFRMSSFAGLQLIFPLSRHELTFVADEEISRYYKRKRCLISLHCIVEYIV